MTERISIVSDEISQDLETVARFLDEFHLRALEIRTIGGKRVPDIDAQVWEDLKRHVRIDGWEILAMSPGTFKGHYSDRSRLESELDETLPRTAELANQIGTQYMITFGFTADRGDEVPGHALDALRRAADLCAQSDLLLLLENEPGSLADTGERTRELLDSVDHPNLFANWDPCNSGLFDDPESLARGARALVPYIRHVHVKDGVPSPGSVFPRYGPISSGHLGWGRHLEELKAMGYHGYLGVETHYEPLYEGSATLLSELRELADEIDFWGEEG